MNKLKIFVSSTCYDLSSIRTELFEFILAQGHQPILSEYNSFPIDPDNGTIENCIENVKGADIFILVIGNRYGYTLESGKSITNTEYLYARENSIPIYVFIDKSFNSLLSEWNKDKALNFSDKVDSVKLFEFAESVKTTNKNWCYSFIDATFIMDTLKIQTSHLFKQALDIRRKFKTADHPSFYQSLSPQALNILLERDICFEIEFFMQVLKDEIEKYENLKLDLEYKILTSCNREVKTIQELISWLQVDFETMCHLINSCNNLFEGAYKKFYGEPGVPSDLKGLYYVACTLARIFRDMITWSINMKSVMVDEDFVLARDLISDFMALGVQKIWVFPSDALKTIRDGIKKYKETKEPMNTDLVLTLEMDSKVTNTFHSELRRLNQKLLDGSL